MIYFFTKSYLKHLFIGSAVIGCLTTGAYAMMPNSSQKKTGSSQQNQNNWQNLNNLPNFSNNNPPSLNIQQSVYGFVPEDQNLNVNSNLIINSETNIDLRTSTTNSSSNLSGSQYFMQTSASQLSNQKVQKLSELLDCCSDEIIFTANVCKLDHENGIMMVLPKGWKKFIDSWVVTCGNSQKQILKIMGMVKKYMQYFRDVKGYEIVGDEEWLNNFIGPSTNNNVLNQNLQSALNVPLNQNLSYSSQYPGAGSPMNMGPCNTFNNNTFVNQMPGNVLNSGVLQNSTSINLNNNNIQHSAEIENIEKMLIQMEQKGNYSDVEFSKLDKALFRMVLDRQPQTWQNIKEKFWKVFNSESSESVWTFDGPKNTDQVIKDFFVGMGFLPTFFSIEELKSLTLKIRIKNASVTDEIMTVLKHYPGIKIIKLIDCPKVTRKFVLELIRYNTSLKALALINSCLDLTNEDIIQLKNKFSDLNFNQSTNKVINI